jgi:hypothetical protein
MNFILNNIKGYCGQTDYHIWGKLINDLKLNYSVTRSTLQ